jgi:acyl-CoA synthetase (AMP-forming)/AMP-acid ligase II
MTVQLDDERPPVQTTADNIHRLLEAATMSSAADAMAIAAPGRQPLSYRGLLRQVEGTVGALRSAGLKRNDRVAMVLPNGPEMAAAFLGVAAGATCAPLNPGFTEKEFDFYLADLNARALIVAPELASAARRVARDRRLPIIELTSAHHAEAGTFTLGGDAGSAAHEPEFAEAADTALVLHTSGTTSRPKIVPLTQANICRSAFNTAGTLRLTSKDRCLNVMPLFHIHGLIGALLSSLSAGASVVCTPGFDPQAFF